MTPLRLYDLIIINYQYYYCLYMDKLITIHRNLKIAVDFSVHPASQTGAHNILQPVPLVERRRPDILILVFQHVKDTGKWHVVAGCRGDFLQEAVPRR